MLICGTWIFLVLAACRLSIWFYYIMCRNAVYYMLCTLGSACVFFVAIVSKTRSVFTARYEINLRCN